MRAGAAGRLKGCGLKSGMPDILIFFNGFTIGLELKADHGTVSPIQKEMHVRLKAAGIFVHIARSVEEVEELLRMRGVPMRGHNLGKQTPEGRRPQKPAQGAAGAATQAEGP